MNAPDFFKAVEILTSYHSNEVVINKSTGNGSTTGTTKNPTLHIRNCVGAVVKRLINDGYSLSMNDGLMTVDKY